MDDHPSLWDPPKELVDIDQLKGGPPRHGIGRAGSGIVEERERQHRELAEGAVEQLRAKVDAAEVAAVAGE